MMRFFFFISITCALFLNSNLGPYLGFEKITIIAFVPITLFIILRSVTDRIRYDSKKNTNALYLLILAVIIIVAQYYIGQNYFRTVLCFLIIPMFISICFEDLSYKEVILLRKIVLSFFLIECSLAIIERILGINFFYTEDLTYEEIIYSVTKAWEFRSTALLPHPLANAMVVVVLLVFIILSQIQIRTKLICALLGYLSLFCFNARGAILFASLIIIPYFIFYLNKKMKNKKELLNTGILMSLFILFFLITTTGFGGRIIHSGSIWDGSAKTRIQVFEFYHYLNSMELYFGSPKLYYYIMNKLGAGGVENGVIVLILQYGLVFVIPLLILLFLFQLKKLNGYSKYEKGLILSTFYIMGTMNPALSSSVQWIVWVLGYYAFRRISRKRIFYSQKTTVQ